MKVYYIDNDDIKKNGSDVPNWFSSYEILQITFPVKDLTTLGLYAYQALAHVLLDEFHLTGPLIISKTLNGKPFIENCQFTISISHYENGIVFSIATYPHGIDAEIIKQVPNSIVNRFFSQKNQIKLSGSCNRTLDSCKMWTQMEALTKLIGANLDEIIQNIELNKDVLFFANNKYISQSIQLRESDLLTVVFPMKEIEIEVYKIQQDLLNFKLTKQLVKIL